MEPLWGPPLRAGNLGGWGCQTVARGWAERRRRSRCLGAPSACSGRTRWAARQPPVAAALRQLAEAHAHQDPTFRPSVTSTRLTAQAAWQALRGQGERAEPWPAPSPMAAVLHRLGVRCRQVVQAQPQKQSKATDPLFDHRKKRGASRAIRPRQTREYRWASAREHRRIVPRRSPPGRICMKLSVDSLHQSDGGVLFCQTLSEYLGCSGSFS